MVNDLWQVCQQEAKETIVFKLSNFDQPVSREELKTSLELSSTDFINGLDSLQQRYLVTKIKEDKILFNLSPVFRKYVKSCGKNKGHLLS